MVQRLLNQILEGLEYQSLLVSITSVENHVNQIHEGLKIVDVLVCVFISLLALPWTIQEGIICQEVFDRLSLVWYLEWTDT